MLLPISVMFERQPELTDKVARIAGMGYDKPILGRTASIDALTDITEQLEILGISISV